MKKLLMICATACCILLLAACGGTKGGEAGNDSTATDAAAYHKITPEQAKARMDSGDTVIVLDVRTQEEYDEGHIADALLIPNETIANDPPAQLADQDAEILIYCRSGNRSRKAAEKLIAMGYTNAYDFGGISDWPYDIVK